MLDESKDEVEDSVIFKFESILSVVVTTGYFQFFRAPVLIVLAEYYYALSNPNGLDKEGKRSFRAKCNRFQLKDDVLFFASTNSSSHCALRRGPFSHKRASLRHVGRSFQD
jgi:hypothetical protein